MDSIRVETPQNVALDFEPGTLGDRIGGALIDGALLAVYLIAVLMLLASFSALRGWPAALPFLPVIGYNLFMEVFFDGQSFGKKMMHLRVISLDGKRASLSQYLIRWMFRLVDFLLTECLCAVFTVALSKKRQRLGDMVAGTAVIKLEGKTTLADTLYVPVPAGYQVRYEKAAALSAADVQLIKEVLRYYRNTGNLVLVHEAAEKTADVLGVALREDAHSFLTTILEDYNYLASLPL